LVLLFGMLLESFGCFAGQQAPSEEDLFKQVFGESRSAFQEINVPLYLDNHLAGEIPISILSDQVLVDRSTLGRELEGKLQPDIHAQMMEGNTNRQISIQALEALGVQAVFDEADLELRVRTTPAVRAVSTVDLLNRAPSVGGETVSPSAFSTYVNLRTGMDYVQQSASGRGEGLQPFRADLEGAVNLNGWVIEGTGSYSENAPSLWRRDDLRLVRDDPERMIRYSAGDLAYPTTGFQTFQPMLGVTAARNFSLQPYRVTHPLGQTSFFLKAPSTVQVLVNGQQVQTLQLPAGPHNLRDFLFASGANDVVLRITDDVGRVETIQLSFFFDAQLLAQGEHEFSYSIGAPSRFGETGPEYEYDLPVLSLFHRLGITDRLTAGVNFQGNEQQQLFGMDAVWATRLGTFQPDIGMSTLEGHGLGYAARLGYRYYDAASPLGTAFALSAQYTSPSFAPLGNRDPFNVAEWRFSARYSQRLGWGVHGGIGGTYELRREAPTALSGLNIFMSKRFGRNSYMDITLDRRETVLGKTEYRAYASLSVFFDGGRQNVRTTHDTFTRTTRSDWRYNSARHVGGLDGNLGVQRTPDDYSLFGAANYTGYRAEASLAHDITTPSHHGEELDSRTRLRFGTALVYAGGQFALSRPVRDSFAIVAAQPEVKGQKIGVDPVADGHLAKINRWGPAVIPDLNPYLVRKLSIDAPELPPGYDIGPGAYAVQPTYKSGTVIVVGSDATVLLGGLLEAPDGTPISLQAGEIVAIGEEQRVVEFFTNRRGKFNAEGLRPGFYEMRLFLDSSARITFEIPKGTAGFYEIGTLKFPLDLAEHK
jgi:outer membrane usher protein